MRVLLGTLCPGHESMPGIAHRRAGFAVCARCSGRLTCARAAADAFGVGIEQAAARVREIQAMTQGIAAAGVGATAASPAAAAADPSQAAAFTSQLQAQLLLGGASPTGASPTNPATGLGGLPVVPAELLQSQGIGPGSNALGVQAMLAGMMPQAAAPVGGPSRLSGDLDGMNPGLRQALEQVAAAIGKDLEVISGHRSYQEQAALYQKYLNGTGNLAAPPGHSNHESGDAADVYVNGVALQNVPGAAEAAKAAGLGFPVGGEPWHVEHVR